MADVLVPVRCCDFHGVRCEPPSELCCQWCTEARHPQHLAHEQCVLDRPDRCEAYAVSRMRTGGTCDTPLDEHGRCPNASDHKEV